MVSDEGVLLEKICIEFNFQARQSPLSELPYVSENVFGPVFVHLLDYREYIFWPYCTVLLLHFGSGILLFWTEILKTDYL